MRVLVAAQDVGGANALAPVLDVLAREHDARITLWSVPPATEVFARRGWRALELGPAPGPDAGTLAPRMVEAAPDVLLVGTSWGPSLEKTVTRLASQAGIPSLAVVDMWSHYRERFLVEEGRLELPTRIALMDEAARQEAIRAGGPADRLVVTGQPHLGALEGEGVPTEVEAEAERLRAEWTDGDPAVRVVLFASEAYSLHFGPGTPHYRGYVEGDALRLLREAIGRGTPDRTERFTVVVRPHPQEDPESLDSSSEGGASMRLTVGSHPHACVRAADVVVGMASMLLLEAAVLGRRVISLRPGPEPDDAFVGTRLGWAPRARTSEDLARLLAEALEKPATPQRRLGHHNAAREVARLLATLAETTTMEAT